MRSNVPKAIALCCVLAWPALASAQSGCTDPQALNYDPTALTNDGSCQYAPTLYSPPLVAILPAELDECSGLAFFANRLVAHQDGGNPAEVFELDSANGNLLSQWTIPDGNQTDWEDLAESPDHLFIGDFGNNSGDRTDLRILRIPKTGLLAGNPVPEVIAFSFSDQTDFTPAPNATNFDLEAFLFLNDSLHLFSKNWLDAKTRHYVLPATPGEYVTELRDSFDVAGQLTAADATDDGRIVLLGYDVSTSEAFIWLLFDYPDGRFFDGNKRRISLGTAITMSQPEGLTFQQGGAGFICAERFSVLQQKLFRFDIDDWTLPTAIPDPGPTRPIALAFPNPFASQFALWFHNPIRETLFLSIHRSDGVLVLHREIPPGTQNPLVIQERDLSGASGPYFLSLRNADGVLLERAVLMSFGG